MPNSQKIDNKEIIDLLFQLPQEKSHSSCPEGAKDIDCDITKEIILACRFYLSSSDSPTILYFPAAGDSLDSFTQIPAFFQKFGMNVFYASYRGSGKSSGSPSIATLLEDSVMLVPFVKRFLAENGYSDSLFVMGRSLGSICAVEATSQYENDIKGMIIESGICSIPSYLTALGLNVKRYDLSEDDGYNMISRIEDVKTPTLIFHGAKDELAPVSQAEKIQSFCGARNKQFLIIPGGTHNNLSQIGGELFFKTIKQFTDTVCGVNTWRGKRKRFRSPKEV